MNRKDEHVKLATTLSRTQTNSFDDIKIIHNALPNVRVADVSIATSIGELSLTSPFFINAMTGGSEETKKINQELAMLARETGLMLATGSVSAALQHPEYAESFQIVREEYPEGTLLANVGIGTTLANANIAVELFKADGLQIHLNAPQELVMPEGDRDFRDWLINIGTIVSVLEVPVIVKEVGFGMTRETIEQLLTVGAKIIDISGQGGTSFTQIENARRKHQEFSYLVDYGIPTVASILEANEVEQTFDLIASGGVRTAYDIFKALCLGAKAVGVSGAIIEHLLAYGLEKTIALVTSWQTELQTLYALGGKTTTAELVQVPLLITGETKAWCEARNIDIRKYSMR